jgi:hypothetical protein
MPIASVGGTRLLGVVVCGPPSTGDNSNKVNRRR